MGRFRLNVLKGKAAFESFIVDAEHFKKIPKEGIASFLKWLVRFRVRDEIYTEEQWKAFTQNFGFKSVEEFLGATKFGSVVFSQGASLKRSELEEDLTNLGFEQEKTDLVLNGFESAWGETEEWLKRARGEAVPILTSLRWRVDVRYASSDYMGKPEPIAILRIGVNDGSEKSQIYIELDKDRLSWLESTIGKMKREFLKAEERLPKTSVDES